MVYKLLIFILVSGICGIKKPLYGGVAGLISAGALYLFFSPFDLPTFSVLLAFGLGLGFLCGRITWWLFHGMDDAHQKTKTHVKPITFPGGGQRGCLIYTDEEEKNAKENKTAIP